MTDTPATGAAALYRRAAGEDEPAAVADSREDAFDRAWQSPPGLRSVSAVNHTLVGRRFVVTGFVFFLIAGVLALLIRTQLAVPNNTFLGHDAYNQIFTIHGTAMMFLFAVPILEGAAVYMLPLLIGSRDLPFPRLSSFGYWCYLFGGVLLLSGFLFGSAPDGGWFIYPPLTGPIFSPGKNIDFWLLGITFVEISAIGTSIELIVAILKTRAPGMSIDRMPLFAWYILVTAFMILLGFPPLIMGSILLELERAFHWPFFEAAEGGSPILWQHLFWLFGHPEVYIILLPAVGILSMVVPTFARRPMFGYSWFVLAAVGTGFLSFGLWVHHMYAVGIPQLSLAFFSAASLMVAIPSGIQVFALIATLWLGRPVPRTPLLFVIGFVIIFTLGGFTGVMVAIVPFDHVVHDTQFVVAHFHYVLIGGAVFPLFAGIYYWLPFAIGRMPSERLGRWSFWVMFIGFNVAFMPLHHTGLAGMPRRVYIYPAGLGWEWTNLAATVGATPSRSACCWSWRTSPGRCAGAPPPATTPGAPERWSGCRARRPRTTSAASRLSRAATRSGTGRASSPTRAGAGSTSRTRPAGGGSRSASAWSPPRRTRSSTCPARPTSRSWRRSASACSSSASSPRSTPCPRSARR